MAIVIADDHLSRGRGLQPGDRLDERGFSRSVGSEQPSDRPPLQRTEAHPVEYVTLPVRQVQVRQADVHDAPPKTRCRVRMRETNTGTPTSAVMIPIGIATPGMMVIDRAWAVASRKAPVAAEAGAKYRCSSPTRMRATWGPTRPTNPMTPAKATVTAASSDARIRIRDLSRGTFTPMAAARSSPSLNAVSCPECLIVMGIAIARTAAMMAFEVHVAR